MSHIINAVYENGVFKPLENVSIKEHKKVRIILENETETVFDNHFRYHPYSHPEEFLG